MSIPFDRLRRALIPRPRPSARLEIPAAFGATDAELARLGAEPQMVDCVRQQDLALVYGGRRPC